MFRLTILLGLALSLAACGGGGHQRTGAAASPTGRGRRSAGTTAAGQPAAATVADAGRVLFSLQAPASKAYAAGGSLYLAHTVPADEHTEEIYDLNRVDPVSGRVLATHRFTSLLDDMVLADRSLWVTTTSGPATSLWRLDPRSLAVRSSVTLPSSRHSEGIAGSLAAAGDQLWVGAGLLDRVSPATGRVVQAISPPHPGPVQLAANSSGHVLLASLGYRHPTYIARLNPRTGAVVSRVTVAHSVSQPVLGGIVDGGAWIQNTVDARTTIWRINATTLATTPASRRSTPSGRISVQVIDSVLWVTEPQGQDNLNYCADPVTAQPRARLPLLPGDSDFLTADGTAAYYTYLPVNAHAVKLESAPVSRACTAAGS